MNIRQLMIFRTVCEEKSFTRAAGRLYMTQPAISHVIADLEREAGTPLFDRISRRIILNRRGEELLEKANRLLELYEELETELKDLETGSLLRLGSSITIAGFWLPGWLRRFESECGDTPVTVQVDSAKNTARRLAEGSLDLALIEGGAYLNQFESITLSSYEVIPLCSPSYLRRRGGRREGSAARPADGGGGQSRLRMKEFAAERLLLRESGSAIRDVLDGAFMQNQLAAEPYWTSVNSQVLIQAALDGLGITVLPEILVRRELEEGSLIKVEVEGLNLRNENHIVYYKEKYLTSPMKKWIEIVTQETAEKPVP